MASSASGDAKARAGVSRALIGLLIVGILAAGVLYFGGWNALATLLGLSEPATETAEPVPSKPSDPPPVAPTSSVTVPDEALEQMYFEQLASQELIGKLVAGEIAALKLSKIEKAEGAATIRVEASLKDAAVIGGAMELRTYDSAWFFYMITRDPYDKVTPKAGSADTALMRTIVEQQAVSQDIPQAMLGGTYDSVEVGEVKPGAGTREVAITLTGASAPPLAGVILCLEKQGKWFITSFERR